MQTKKFNITGACNPRLHYMVDLESRLKQIDERIDGSTYFSVVKPRQSGKTTLMFSLGEYLQEKYFVVMLDFQMIGTSEFNNEASFSKAFLRNFLRSLKCNYNYSSYITKEFLTQVTKKIDDVSSFSLLFETLSNICKKAKKPIVLMIDEADTAMHLPIFFDFLAQLRACYLYRETTPTFYSVFLFGTKDFNLMQMDLERQDGHKLYGPWNIFTDFDIDLNFTSDDIAGMLKEYEEEHETCMNISKMADALFELTSGYPFLVSKLCNIIDEKVMISPSWNSDGLKEAEKIFGEEIEAAIQRMPEQLEENPALKDILKTILFHAITS